MAGSHGSHNDHGGHDAKGHGHGGHGHGFKMPVPWFVYPAVFLVIAYFAFGGEVKNAISMLTTPWQHHPHAWDAQP